MVRRAFGAAALALALAPDAAAHVTVTPSRVEPGADVVLSFAVPNEEDPSPVTRVSIALPGFEIDDVEAPPGWSATTSEGRVSWSGGRIEARHFENFFVRGTAPESRSRLVFNTLAVHASGRADKFSTPLTVEALRVSSRDSGARTLGKVALGVAIAAALVALATFFLALSLWIRRTE